MWPDNFPDQCPPSDARQDEISVYRLVSNTPPTADDFKSVKEESPHREFTGELLCMAHGLSVYRNKADILKTRSKYKPLRSKKIAVGKITHSDGVIKETGGASHVTWWLQTTTPHANFSEVNDV